MKLTLLPLLLLTPLAALADLSETTVLLTNTGVNMDTGAIVTSGGDLFWNGTTLVPQGGAKARIGASLGTTNFNGLPESYWDGVVAGAKATPVTTVSPGDGGSVMTNGGNVAKILIIQNSSGALGIEFVTFKVAPLAGIPIVNGILNNSSNTPLGFPSYGVAPSSLFIVTGSGLSDPGAPVLQSSAAPGLPLTLNGASITVVVNGVTTHPALYYTSPGQVAAVLPAATPAGTGTLTVTYRGSPSPPAPILVVPAVVGINSYYGSLGVATDANGNLLTFTSSGSPGQTIVLWSTGLGADPADSDTTYSSAPQSVNTPLQIYIGGISANIRYQGSAGYPGVNQINVTIPPNVNVGCLVSVAAVTGTFLSNTVTIPVANGGGECFEQISGLKGSQIPPPTITTLRTGQISLAQDDSVNTKGVHTVSTAAGAVFIKFTGIQTPGLPVSPGGCIVFNNTAQPVGVLSPLDAGTVKLSGPAGISTTLAPELVAGQFGATLTAIPAAGGSYTFQGAGGTDVGPFTSTLTFTGPLLQWTNSTAATTVNRSQGFTYTWIGGNAGTYPAMTGVSTSSLVGVGFQCRANVADGKFTVPPYILQALPAGSGGAGFQDTLPGTLTATGLDATQAGGLISFNVAGSYQ
ncbi:MAG TPA: hypothetical protein VGN17_00665 [Bryobacteraceae bacterium]